jgi:hypothetical protein
MGLKGRIVNFFLKSDEDLKVEEYKRELEKKGIHYFGRRL